jgi:hypothetical protein
MEQDHHAIEVCHAADGFSPVGVYAHCTCGGKSGRCQLTGTEVDGKDVAVAAAEVDGMRHVEQAIAPRI